VEAATDVWEKMLKQNAVRSKNAKLKCRKFSTRQKREFKMQRKISVLQYIFYKTRATAVCSPTIHDNIQ